MRSLRFDNVSLVYESDEELVALNDLDFELAGGESIAIIGPSGCGKSSSLRLAAGLRMPTKGQVTIDGEPVAGPREQTGLILQDFGLLPWKTVQKNAELGLKIRGVGERERKRRAHDALALVGLSGFAASYPNELSGGMRQRLALARSLALDVDLLLMDEPLSALDALLREQLQDTLLDLWRKQGYAQILVTHSIDEAVYLGQRILVMSPLPGRVVAQIDNPDAGDAAYRSSAEFHELGNEIRSILHEAVGAHDA